MNTLNPDFRSGMVSIVGRPNTGKSTLLNAVVGEKIAIVSTVPQTTRNAIRGIYTDARGQVVFIDTPGFHKGKDRLDRFMNTTALGTAQQADCIIHLVDCSRPAGPEEGQIVEQIDSFKLPVILGLNKVDLTDRYFGDYIRLWEERRAKKVTEMEGFVLMPLSGQTGIHIKELLEVIFQYLPPGPALYPEDTVTDAPQRMVIADIIREKLFCMLRQEVPHALAVLIEDLEEGPKLVRVRALILVERHTQKQIVVGKKGGVLKEAGTAARLELEKLLEKKVFLELFVKDKGDWRDDPSILEEMGYAGR